MGDPTQVFGFYVEKENIGKRIKSSKVRVVWKLCMLPRLELHDVELKHTVRRGFKMPCLRRIAVDGQMVFMNKDLFNSDFSHDFMLEGHSMRLTIRDNLDQTWYDLKVDGVPFHRLTRVTAEQLEEMRSDPNSIATSKMTSSNAGAASAGDSSDQPVMTLKFDDFVKDANGQTKKKKKKKQGKKYKANEENNSSSDTDVDSDEELWKSFNDSSNVNTASTSAAVPPPQQLYSSSSSQVDALISGLKDIDFSAPPAPAASNPFASPQQNSYLSQAYTSTYSAASVPPQPLASAPGWGGGNFNEPSADQNYTTYSQQQAMTSQAPPVSSASAIASAAATFVHNPPSYYQAGPDPLLSNPFNSSSGSHQVPAPFGQYDYSAPLQHTEPLYGNNQVSSTQQPYQQQQQQQQQQQTNPTPQQQYQYTSAHNPF